MKSIKQIIVLGPAHPYRGGLAAIMETMARIFQRRGAAVRIETFTVQYPSFLFPGESQTIDTPAPDDLQIVRRVNTVNPFNWWRVGQRLRRERPDVILLKYWTPFMAPCFGTIARLARRNGHTKVLCQIDNVEPHEHHVVDRPFNRYFLRAVDGFVYMSEQVHRELRGYTDALALFSPHPMFEHFGGPIDRTEACARLGVNPACGYVLFFGLIRDYKGLDMLLDAWARLKDERRTLGRKLLVAGEFYTDRRPYLEQIERLGLQEDVVLHDRFVADEAVKNYFSAADFLVLPYRTATQSGVTQIAYRFGVPMVVTEVGGLPEIVPDGRAGIVCRPEVGALAEAMGRMFDAETLQQLRKGVRVESRRFSWDEMCDRIEELYGRVASRG